MSTGLGPLLFQYLFIATGTSRNEFGEGTRQDKGNVFLENEILPAGKTSPE
jgi:hypothetical protein